MSESVSIVAVGTTFDVGQMNQVLAHTIIGARIHFYTVTDIDGGKFMNPDVVLLDMELTEGSSTLLRGARIRWPTVPLLGLVRVSPEGTGMWGRFRTDDLDDFLFYPFDEGELVLRIRRVLRNYLGRQDTAERPLGRTRIETLVGESECFQTQVDKIQLFAEVDAAVLLQGETGTGKELFARAIHYKSARRGQAFIPINCAALPDQLFENELFGHVRGAYTSASTEQRGLVQEAEGGTLFLDEVDSLSPSVQAKLLRFVQDREYRPLGSAQTKVADVRLIAASNGSLGQAVAERRFREDLFHRLNVLSLIVPPLRDRIEDIPLLAAHFIRRHRRVDGTRPHHLSSAALQKLLGYAWPGNVRELESTLQRAVVFSKSETIDASEIEFAATSIGHLAEESSLRAAKSSAVQNVERAYLIRTLAECQGNVTHAARVAGKERRSFQRLLRKYRIDRQIYAQTDLHSDRTPPAIHSHPPAG